MISSNLPVIPHEDVADLDCWGCLIAEVRGDEADITCNECDTVTRTVAAHEAAAIMERLMMEAAA